MNAGELSVTVGELIGDGALRFRPAASDFRFGKFETVGLNDADAMLGARNRIQNRLAPHFQYAIDAGAGAARVNIHLEVDSGEERCMQRIAGRGEDVEDRGEGLGVFPAQDACERLALCGGGAFVDDVNAFAFALVNWPGPAKDSRGAKAIEPRRASYSRSCSCRIRVL